jgi:cytidylate kinase
MAVITIARELGSLAEDIAGELSAVTGYRNIDKAALEARLSAMAPFGLSDEKRQKFDEKKPGFWASLSQERDTYLHFLKTAVFEEAAAGSCILVGRGAGAILKGLPNLLNLRLSSPLAVRIERIKTLYSCTDKTALELIERNDHDRRGFHKYFFAVNWEDPREYDLCINTGNMSARKGASILSAMIGEYIDPGKESACAERLSDLILAQTVLTEIGYRRKIPIHFLEATAARGSILLHGVSNTQSAIDTALAAARSVAGVSDVESAIQIVQEFSVVP